MKEAIFTKSVFNLVKIVSGTKWGLENEKRNALNPLDLCLNSFLV